MNKSIFRLLKKNDCGVSLIEFAIITPFLLALVLGIVEFGWIFNGYVTLNGAVREGARVASMNKTLPGDDGYDGYIEDEVKKHITKTMHIETVDVIKTLQDNVNNPKEWGAKITAHGSIQPLVGIFVTGESFPLSAEATMRIQ